MLFKTWKFQRFLIFKNLLCKFLKVHRPPCIANCAIWASKIQENGFDWPSNSARRGEHQPSRTATTTTMKHLMWIIDRWGAHESGRPWWGRPNHPPMDRVGKLEKWGLGPNFQGKTTKSVIITKGNWSCRPRRRWICATVWTPNARAASIG